MKLPHPGGCGKLTAQHCKHSPALLRVIPSAAVTTFSVCKASQKLLLLPVIIVVAGEQVSRQVQRDQSHLAPASIRID
jgi:hypothetical protein